MIAFMNVINNKKWWPYLFIAPSVILLVGFLFYPIANVFVLSLQNYNPTKPYANGFTGFDNFTQIFTNDKIFYSTLVISLKWVLSEVVLQLLLGLILALLLNQTFRFRGLARAAAFLPWAISGVITATMWSIMFNEHFGVINDLLKRIGFLSQNMAWTANPSTAFGSIVTAELWRGIPFFAITLLAAMQNIPGELYESCKVDGGGRWRSFFSITLPYLKDTIILTTLLRAVWEFNNVDLIFTMTGGGPANMTMTLPMYIANQAIKSNNYGYGSALTVIGVILLTIFAALYLKFSGFGKEE
ncbi:sugar ABC transporter permease [Paenibacillus sp. YSY-4.3]